MRWMSLIMLLLLIGCGDFSDRHWLAVGQSNMARETMPQSFADEMRLNGIEIDLTIAAIGSTDIQCWRYNGDCWVALIKPLIGKSRIDGILYWQGETEARFCENDSCMTYNDEFIGLINEYREDFGYDIPFIFVILQNYDEDKTTQEINEPYSWSQCRENQLQALELENVYGVETRDITNGDIHPIESYEEIGKRAATIATQLY